MKVRGIDHAQIAMPGGDLWFHCGSIQLHLGMETDFRAATKAHPALLVEDLAALLGILKGAGCEVNDDKPLKGFDRAFALDLFGNRVELLEPHSK